MTAEEIEILFLETIKERGIYSKIGVDRANVSNWKGARPASFGTMVEVLLKLGKIRIEKNG